MVAVQESYAQAILPYAINLSERVFDIFNGLGLVFVPFVVMFVITFMETRAQGLDEGSPGINAIKTAEKNFWPMLILLILFVIPMGEVGSKAKFTKFQCSGSEQGSTRNALYRIGPELGELGQELAGENARLPLAIGLSNNVSVGISEALSSQIACNKTKDTMEAELDKALIEVKDQNLVSNLRLMASSCYGPAQGRIATGISNHTTKLANPYSKEKNYFFGDNLRLSYRGLVNSTPQQRLTLRVSKSEYVGNIKSEYYPDNFEPNSNNSTHYYQLVNNGYQTQNSYQTQNTTSELLIGCDDVAKDMKMALEAYIQNDSNHLQAIDRIAQSYSIFPQAMADGTLKNLTKDDVFNSYLHQAFLDAVTGKRSVIVPGTPHETTILSQAWELVRDGVRNTAVGSDLDTKSFVKERLVNIGMGMSMFEKAAERTNLYLILPLFITIITAVVYVASPFLFVISGYSWSLAMNILFVHFYLAMSHYMLNLALFVSDLLWLLADSAYGYVTLKNAGLALHYMALSAPVVVLLCWTMVCVAAGLNLGPFLVGLFTVNAAAAAKAGTALTKQALTRGASGTMDTNKRQIG